ncbi:hypothetical protein LCGC14_1707820 [marine sediment metagenome]|uniref:Uncharacterized protein n=1 Tax=marine sediment metagenome TaxID=412755 RepID=A0A0F9I3P6_9ZZZZ
MRIRCIHHSTEKFFKKKSEYEFFETYETDLIIGKEYNVYGLIYYNDIYKYLIFDENNTPFWYLNKLFEIIDNKISKFWYLDFLKEESLISAMWGYYELVNIENHNDDLMKENKDNLEEKEKAALDIFYQRKKEMDLEFPDDSIKEKASIVDNNWLMCPTCVDAWESNSIFAMIECPKCKKVMHNPRNKK